MPDFSDVHVRLKPVLGIEPGTYLAVLYAVAFLLLVFVFLFLPGLKANGTVVSFASDPPGAGVWVDGQWRGVTPCEVFVPRGERTVELRKAFYETARHRRAYRGRVFATLLFPLRESHRERLQLADPRGLAEWTRKQVSQWGLLRDFSSAYRLPHHLSEAVAALARRRDPALQPEIDSLLATASGACDSQAELAELAAAWLGAHAHGSYLSSVSVVRALRAARRAARASAWFPVWAAQALDSRSPVRAALVDSPAFAAYADRVRSAIDRARQSRTTPAAQQAVVVRGIRLFGVPGGVELVGRGPSQTQQRLDPFLPYPVIVEPFYLGETEVTRAQFAEFLKAQPAWADRGSLVREGLATDSYLEGWTGDRYPEGTGSLPVTGVSRFAADAFCEWLDQGVPDWLRPYRVMLPSEAEWQRAAGGPDAAPPEGAVFLAAEQGPRAVGSSKAAPYGHRDLWGNVWEWTRDVYLPARNLLSPLDPRAFDPLAGASGAEFVVKGGSWANPRQDFRSFVRGSQPPEWCTPFLGFRVALVRARR